MLYTFFPVKHAKKGKQRKGNGIFFFRVAFFLFSHMFDPRSPFNFTFYFNKRGKQRDVN